MTYFTICYKLSEKISGKEFNENKTYNYANVLASSKDEAISKLKDDFKMLSVDVLSISEEKTMSEDQFLEK